MIKIPEMCQFVTQSIDETRLLEQSAGTRVSQSNADHPVLVTDAVPLRDIGLLRLERGVAQIERLPELDSPAAQFLKCLQLFGATA